jgi:dTDP-N-acetylfucosamine:lipid II N-acetylfucosaminyltransferase
MAFISEVFESVAPGSNEYVIEALSDSRSERFPIRVGQVHRVPAGLRGLARVRSKVRYSDIVIAHSMGVQGAVGLAWARPGALRVWSGWGGDYYGSDVSRDSGLLGSSTLELSSSLSASLARTLGAAKGRIRGAIRREAAKRTDYFSSPIPEDYVVFRRRFPEFRGGYSQLNYASVEDTFALGPGKVTGDNILVGNSSSFANNHLEVFELLTRQDTSGRKIVVPLSYGDSRSYGSAVLERGRKLFGPDFTPLIDFIPSDQYADLIASCSVVIMGHKRQQALGNVGAALYQGAHVYLDPGSPILEFLRARGAIVQTTTELDAGPLPHGPVPDEALAVNRQMLGAFWARDQVHANVLALIRRLDKSPL